MLAIPLCNVNRLTVDNRLTVETKNITEKSFLMIFWKQSHLILSPTSERTYDLVVLVQRVQSNSFKQVLKNYLNSVRQYREKNVARLNLFEVEAKSEVYQKTQRRETGTQRKRF